MHAHLGDVADALSRFRGVRGVAGGRARYQLRDWADHVAAVPRVHRALVCDAACAQLEAGC